MNAKQRLIRDFSDTIIELATILTEVERQYTARDCIGWFFMWPISMILNMRLQSFSEFMQEYGWKW